MTGTSSVDGTRAPVVELPPHDVAGYHRDIAVLHTTELSRAQALAPSLRAAGFRYIAIDTIGAGA